MDQNPIQPAPASTPNPPQASQRNIVLIVVLILSLALILLVLNYSKIFKKPTSQPQQTTKPSPTPAPPMLKTPRGQIISISNNNLTVKTAAEVDAFTLKETVQVLRITSGTLEDPGTKTAKAKVSDLKVGQEVYLIANNLRLVSSVVIIK